MNSIIDEIYQNSIKNLSNEARTHVQMTEAKIDSIIVEFTTLIEDSKLSLNEKKDLLKKYLFILSHANITSKKTHPSLLKTFEYLKDFKLDADFFVFLLSAVQKQFIDHQSRSGDKIPMELFHRLKELLQHSNAEVLEWTLRTIEALGPQSLLFEKELAQLKPSLLKLFNEHQQNAFKIIDVIKNNWTRFKK